jgi:hypothetical protein
MANPSCSTIIEKARGLIRAEQGTDVPALSDDFLLSCIQDAESELLAAFSFGGGNVPSSLQRETGNTIASETAINDPNGVTSASGSITVDSTAGYDAAGAAVLWDKDTFDLFFYTSITATQFLGVTGIAFSHADNTAIQALYALPSEFGDFRRSELYGDGVSLNGDPLTYMEGPPLPQHFSQVDDGTTTYLWLERGANGVASVLYDKDSPVLDSIDDTVSFGLNAFYYYVWRCIEFGLFGRGDYQILAVAKQKGDTQKLQLLKARNKGRPLRVRQFQPVGMTNYNLALRENAL